MKIISKKVFVKFCWRNSNKIRRF